MLRVLDKLPINVPPQAQGRLLYCNLVVSACLTHLTRDTNYNASNYCTAWRHKMLQSVILVGWGFLGLVGFFVCFGFGLFFFLFNSKKKQPSKT